MEIQMIAKQYDEDQNYIVNKKELEEIFLFDINTYEQLEFFVETENYNTQVLKSFSKELATRIKYPFSIEEVFQSHFAN